jgi:hypothetical protein
LNVKNVGNDVKKKKKKKKKQERDLHVQNVGHDVKHMTPLDEWIRSDLPMINKVIKSSAILYTVQYFTSILLVCKQVLI